MSSSEVSGRPSWHTAITFVLISTTFLGTVVATCGYLVPALAIATKQALGVDAAFIGYQVTLVFGFGGVSSAVSGGFVGRYGPCRVLQAALFLGAAGCLLFSVPNLIVLTIGSVVLGCSYGMTYPAASVLLSRFGSPERINFLYSFRQASTALGAVAAGLVGPFVAIFWGWQGAFYVLAAVALILTVGINGLRPYWDDLADRKYPISAPWAGVRIILANRPLFMLCFVGFGFSAVQVGVLAFLVLFLAEEVNFTLAQGGLALSLINILGASSRMFWGWRADHLKNSLVVVSTMGVVTAFVIAIFSFASPDWPNWLIFAVLSLFGMATFGWSGIVMANIASRAEPTKIAETVGGALGFMFSGAWVGPSIGSVILQITGNYRHVFTFLCVTALIAAAMAVRVSFQRS